VHVALRRQQALMAPANPGSPDRVIIALDDPAPARDRRASIATCQRASLLAFRLRRVNLPACQVERSELASLSACERGGKHYATRGISRSIG
jgi:hypothetical protein